MSNEQLCDREDLVKRIVDAAFSARVGKTAYERIRQELVELGLAKMVEPPMTESKRIVTDGIVVRPLGISIFGRLAHSPITDVTLYRDLMRETIEPVIDAALAQRTEDAAKIVEDQFYGIGGPVEAYVQGAAAAIRKLGESK